MATRGTNVEVSDFKGGLNTFDPEYLTPITQSPDLDNIIILEKGFKKRQGDTAFNASVMGSSSTAIQGLGYVQFNSGTEFLNAIAGSKFYTSSGISGTMADATGALTITAGQNNIWTPLIFNNLQIWFGGAPDAPFKYSGSGSGVSLGGTPPSAATGFVANNRPFAISTTANPSRIYWPVVSNPEDWTGAGFGTADVALSDGEALQCGVVLGTDTAILFKNSSSHLMVLTRQPFPIYQLQKGIGVAGRYAAVNVKGTIYIITPSKRMKSTTDGYNFQDYPTDVNDLWDSVNSTRLPYVQGIYYPGLEWLVWVVSTGTSTTNNYAIIWDLQHKCWLRCTKGYKANVLAIIQNRRLFAGHYNGQAFEKDKATVYTDASETSPGTIDAYWRTPFRGLEGLDSTIHPLYITFAAQSEVATIVELSYGFDFTSAQKLQNFSLVASGGLWDQAKWDVDVWGGNIAVAPRMFVSGRGNLFSFKIRNAVASQGFTIQGASLRLRSDKARKLLSVT